MAAIHHIKYKILLLVGLSVVVVVIGIAYSYARHEEQFILEQSRRTAHRLTESAIQGLQSIMLTGYADVAQDYASRLKTLPDIVDFSILKVDGSEAFGTTPPFMR